MENSNFILTSEERNELNALASRITPNKHEADELVKDVFYLAGRHKADKPTSVSVKNWLFAICVSIQHNNVRRGWNVTTYARIHARV